MLRAHRVCITCPHVAVCPYAHIEQGSGLIGRVIVGPSRDHLFLCAIPTRYSFVSILTRYTGGTALRRRRRNVKAAKVMAKVLLMKHAKRRDNGVPADRLEIINCDCPTRETVTCQKHDLFNCELVPHVPRGKPVAGSGSQPFHTELVTREILE